MAQFLWHGLEALLVKNQYQRNVIAHRTVARAVASTGRAGILLEGEVSNIVVAVFHRPISAILLQQLLGICPHSRNRSDAICHLCARRVGFFENLAIALNAKGLAHLLEIYNFTYASLTLQCQGTIECASFTTTAEFQAACSRCHFKGTARSAPCKTP